MPNEEEYEMSRNFADVSQTITVRFIPVSPHDEFAPTSTELDRVRPQPGRVRPQPGRVRPQPDRVRPQPDCGCFHVGKVVNPIMNSFEMKMHQTFIAYS